MKLSEIKSKVAVITNGTIYDAQTIKQAIDINSYDLSELSDTDINFRTVDTWLKVLAIVTESTGYVDGMVEIQDDTADVMTEDDTPEVYTIGEYTAEVEHVGIYGHVIITLNGSYRFSGNYYADGTCSFLREIKASYGWTADTFTTDSEYFMLTDIVEQLRFPITKTEPIDLRTAEQIEIENIKASVKGLTQGRITCKYDVEQAAKTGNFDLCSVSLNSNFDAVDTWLNVQKTIENYIKSLDGFTECPHITDTFKKEINGGIITISKGNTSWYVYSDEHSSVDVAGMLECAAESNSLKEALIIANELIKHTENRVIEYQQATTMKQNEILRNASLSDRTSLLKLSAVETENKANTLFIQLVDMLGIHNIGYTSTAYLSGNYTLHINGIMFNLKLDREDGFNFGYEDSQAYTDNNIEHLKARILKEATTLKQNTTEQDSTLITANKPQLETIETEYVVPVHLIAAIINDDFSGISDEEGRDTNEFIDNLDFGIFEYGHYTITPLDDTKDEYHRNDVTSSYFSTCKRCTFTAFSR